MNDDLEKATREKKGKFRPYPGLSSRLRTAVVLILLSSFLLGGAVLGGFYAWGLVLFTYLLIVFAACELVAACSLSPLHDTQFGSLVSQAVFLLSLLLTPTVLVLLRLNEVLFFEHADAHFMLPYIVVGSAFSLFACLLPVVFQTTTQIHILEKRVLERIIAVFFISVGGGAVMTVVACRSAAELFFWFVFVVAMNDSGAYFVGARYSSPALSPVLSPKKTIFGSLGGLVSGTVAGLATCMLLPLSFREWSLSLWMAFVCGVILLVLLAQLGDLLKSIIKRSHGIKDMGSVLPGHGGVVDRLDGMLMACPYFLGLLLLLQFYT